jgi:AraC-like DNA-binding protein
MINAELKTHGTSAERCRDGFWRTAMVSPGHTLTEAFEGIEKTPEVVRVVRHRERDMVAVTLAPQEGEGHLELTRIRDDIYVVVMNFSYKDRHVEFIPGDGTIWFNFKVSRDASVVVGDARPLRFRRPTLVVWTQPPGVSIDEWTAPQARQMVVAIGVRPEYLTEHFLSCVGDLPPEQRRIVSDPNKAIRYCQLSLTADMLAAATKLINHPSQDKLDLLYTEALTLELLYAAIRSLSAPRSVSGQLTERTLRCLEAARALVARDFASRPSIARISRTVGISQRALTESFKYLYGESIGNFGLRCRMECAMRLLRDERKSVDQVSELVGYGHPTSFSTAFRHYFGIPPISVRHRNNLK